jgi:glucose uptake protein GlcU
LIGEITSFATAFANAFTNTLGGKATKLGNWRQTLRASCTMALVISAITICFNLDSLTLKVFVIGFVAGFCGGSGLPPLYKAFATGSISFAAPVVALMQALYLILFGFIVKGESLGITFPIAAALGVIGLFLCSRTTTGNQKVSFEIFFLAALSATLFTGFSILMTYIDDSQLLAALFGARFGVLGVSLIFSPKKQTTTTGKSNWRIIAYLSGACEITANIFFLIAINNLELSKVGIFMASTPALSALIAIKLLNQRPSLTNWIGIAATCGALGLVAVG